MTYIPSQGASPIGGPEPTSPITPTPKPTVSGQGGTAAEALRVISDQKAMVDASKHDLDPTSQDVLNNFLNKHHGAGRRRDDEPGRVAPVYGAPILKHIPGQGRQPINMAPVYGAPILKHPAPPPSTEPVMPITLAPVYGAPILKRPHDEPGLEPIDGLPPLDPQPIFDPIDGLPPLDPQPIFEPIDGPHLLDPQPIHRGHGPRPIDVAPVYGAPILKRPPHDSTLPPSLEPVTPIDVAPVYGAPILRRLPDAPPRLDQAIDIAPVYGAPILRRRDQRI